MDNWERGKAAHRQERTNVDRHRREERKAYEQAEKKAKKLGCAADCKGRKDWCECQVMRRQERLQASKTKSMIARGVG